MATFDAYFDELERKNAARMQRELTLPLPTQIATANADREIVAYAVLDEPEIAAFGSH